jgi:hypothetical protein
MELASRPADIAAARSPVSESSGISAFARQVMRLLDRTEYRICDRGEDLEAIYRLRYKSYLRGGITDPKPDGMVYDKLDGAQNCRIFGVFVEGELATTIRLHVLDRENRSGPSTVSFNDLLAPRLDAGEIFVDPSKFASDPDMSARHPLLPYLAPRIALNACTFFGADYCIMTVRVNHGAFYRKIFMADMVGGPRDYPGSNVPGIMYQVDVRKFPAILKRYPFFKATDRERSLLFDRPSLGANAPLTVVPQARRAANAA